MQAEEEDFLGTEDILYKTLYLDDIEFLHHFLHTHIRHIQDYQSKWGQSKIEHHQYVLSKPKHD